MNGYPDLFRLFPFERQRPVQTLASFVGINSSPGWSPDGRYLALTLSKDGNRRSTCSRWRPACCNVSRDTRGSTGADLVAERPADRVRLRPRGQPRIFIMDKDGSNVRQLTSSGFTRSRAGRRRAIPSSTRSGRARTTSGRSARRLEPHQLTSGQGDNQGATWAPDGRHLAFQSNRTGRWQLFFMSVDGLTTTQVTQGTNEATSPSCRLACRDRIGSRKLTSKRSPRGASC